MIHPIRKLAREIHRRSVWQVLTVFLLGSWVLLRAVDLLTLSTGLPEWTPAMALVLLLIGLPITVATTAVQGGLPGLRIEDEVDPNELVGLTPEQVLVVPEAHPLYGTGVLTWRNAILGGVMAATLLAGSVTAYLAMWSFGIGPVGSLVAQGVLDERDRIVLAGFVNLTDDEGLGALVTEAFRVDLEGSQIVAILPEERVVEALNRLGNGPEVPRTEEVAREVSELLGAKAFISGDVVRERGSLVLRASVLRTDTGEPLASFREMARGDTDLIAAIDMLAQKVRERIGESLRVIRAGLPLDSATTNSVLALRQYAEALTAEASGDYGRALSLLEDALDIDAGFALARARIAQVQARIDGGEGR
jgi:hypothetical protein